LNNKQKEILNSKSKFKIIQGIRQSGKSSILKLAAIQEVFKPNKIVYLLTNTHIESYKLYKDILHVICGNLKLGIFIKFITAKSIEFVNGSKIIFGSIYNEHDINKIRGIDISLLLIDDAAYNKFYNKPEVYNKFYSKSVIIASTRNSRSKKEFFWALWLQAVLGDSGITPFTLSKKDCPHIKSSINKSTLSKKAYEREYTIRMK
jgi:hypothetical protein